MQTKGGMWPGWSFALSLSLGLSLNSPAATFIAGAEGVEANDATIRGEGDHLSLDAVLLLEQRHLIKRYRLAPTVSIRGHRTITSPPPRLRPRECVVQRCTCRSGRRFVNEVEVSE